LRWPSEQVLLLRLKHPVMLMLLLPSLVVVS